MMYDFGERIRRQRDTVAVLGPWRSVGARIFGIRVRGQRRSGLQYLWRNSGAKL